MKKKSEKGESSADDDAAGTKSRGIESQNPDEIGKDDVEAGFDAYSDQLAKGLLDEQAGGMSDGEDDEDAMWDFSEDDEVEEQDGQDNEDEEMESTNNAEFDEDADFESDIKKHRTKGSNPFADSEDFLQILEQSGNDHLNSKERQWVDHSNSRKGKKRKEGNKSSAGKSNAGRKKKKKRR